MNFSGKNPAFRRLSENHVQSFWKATSNHIFDNSWNVVQRGGMFNSTTDKMVPIEGQKPNYRVRGGRLDRRTSSERDVLFKARSRPVQISDFINRKRKSADKIEFKSKDWFEKYISKKRPKRRGVLVKKEPDALLDIKVKRYKQNLNLLLGSKLLKSQNEIEQTADSRNAIRRSSLDFNMSFKKLPNKVFKLTKSDYIIKFLEKILASSIMQSVFVKDFIILYKRFYKYPNYKFNYRSRSAEKKSDQVSVNKDVMLKSASFEEYLLNIYKHYDLLKNRVIHKTKIGHIFRMQQESNLKESMLIDKFSKQSFHQGLIYKKYKFNFLIFNRDIRHFIMTMKDYIKTGKFALAEQQIQVKKPKKTKDKWPYKPPTFKLQSDKRKMCVAVHQKRESVPFKNSKATVMFQKLVNMSLEQSPPLEFKKDLKLKFTKAVKRTIVITRLNDRDSLKRLFKNKESVISQKPWVVNGKDMIVDINLLYRLPKTMDKNYTRTYQGISRELTPINKDYLFGHSSIFRQKKTTESNFDNN